MEHSHLQGGKELGITQAIEKEELGADSGDMGPEMQHCGYDTCNTEGRGEVRR